MRSPRWCPRPDAPARDIGAGDDVAPITVPLKIDITFFCEKCDGMATAKTCPHDPKHHISISGTRQREMLSNGEDIPVEFSRPEVVKILQEFYTGQG